MKRAAWHVRASSIVFAWLIAAAVVGIAQTRVEHADWLMVHLLLLGAVTSALLIWMRHFSVAVLHLAAGNDRRTEIGRLGVLNVGVVLVLGGALLQQQIAMIIGAVLVAGAIAWLIAELVQGLRSALPARFAMTVHGYVAAAALLLPGLLLGVLLTRTSDDEPMHEQLLVGHVALNLLGWVGLPIFATLVTLWPTVLRTRLVADAERKAKSALWWLIGGTVLTAGAALVGLPRVGAAGVVAYLVGVGLTVEPMLREVRQRRPESFAAWSMLAATAWLTACIAAFGLLLALHVDIDDVTEAADALGVALLVGGVLQMLLGALSVLLPTMVAGGPAAVRERFRISNRATALRLGSFNAALIFGLAIDAPLVRLVMSLVVIASVASTLVTIAASARRQREARIAPR